MRARVLRVANVVAGAALGASVEVVAQPPIDLTRFRLVDLTHAFGSKTLYWPTSPGAFRLEQLAFGQTPGGYFYSAYAFSTPEHGVTHLDAPVHFSANGLTADCLPL